MIGRIGKSFKDSFTVLTSYGCITEAADAHCGDGRRFVVRADEKLTAFIELEISDAFRQSIIIQKSEPAPDHALAAVLG